mgnify:CR=1 FL=1
MEFILRKQWKVEKLRKDLVTAARGDLSIVGEVSTQHSNIQLSQWSAARNITKGDLELLGSVFVVLGVSSVLCAVLPSAATLLRYSSSHALCAQGCHIYDSPLFSKVSLSLVSVIHGHLWSENIKWKIPEMNNS